MHATVRAKTIGPCPECLMVDRVAGVDISQRLTGEPASLLFLVEPRRERLFPDLSPRALQALGGPVDFLGESYRDVRAHHFGIHHDFP